MIPVSTLFKSMQCMHVRMEKARLRCSLLQLHSGRMSCRPLGEDTCIGSAYCVVGRLAKKQLPTSASEKPRCKASAQHGEPRSRHGVKVLYMSWVQWTCLSPSGHCSTKSVSTNRILQRQSSQLKHPCKSALCRNTSVCQAVLFLLQRVHQSAFSG